MSTENSKPQTNPFKKNKFNKNNKKKFQPNFKKKVPVWKQIDEEINRLTPLYDEVIFFSKMKLIHLKPSLSKR